MMTKICHKMLMPKNKTDEIARINCKLSTFVSSTSADGCLLDALFVKWTPYVICNTHAKVIFWTLCLNKITNLDDSFPNPACLTYTLLSNDTNC